MASFVEKRVALHKSLKERQKENETLKSQLGRLQHLATMGTVTHMIAHEINNLLTPVGTYASLALSNPSDEKLVGKALDKAVRNCERAAQITESMLALANDERQEKKSRRVIELVEDVFACLCRDFAKDGITVDLHIPEELKVTAVPVQLQQVLMNLILNARDAMLEGGVLTISATETDEAVEIEVRDTGCGIQHGQVSEIFEPFFTTKKEGDSSSGRSGAGLGLAFCKKVAEAHDGSISVESRPGTGCTFTITLPKA